jgi:hypothetical protein
MPSNNLVIDIGLITGNLVWFDDPWSLSDAAILVSIPILVRCLIGFLVFPLSISRVSMLGVVPHGPYEVAIRYVMARFIEESDMLFSDLFINVGLHM